MMIEMILKMLELQRICVEIYSMNDLGENKMDYEAVMKLALERGFYFPSCEVYGDAQAGFWEYGPSGVSLKNKFLELWRRELIRRDGMLEIDGSQIMSKSVFEASGHLGNFADPIIKCTKCNSTFRADKTIADITKLKFLKVQIWKNLIMQFHKTISNVQNVKVILIKQKIST